MALSCKESDEPAEEQSPAETLSDDTVTTIEIEVDYVAGAEPYTGAVGQSDDLWNLFRVNAARLFPHKEIVVPSTLAEMEMLAGESGNSFTSEMILDIAARHRDKQSSADTVTFYVVWLDGYFEDSDGIQEGVLGVSIGDTGVIAMFKPALALGDAFPKVVRFGEQTTLIHEFGHAIGLVNRGIPLVTEHQDTDNGAHCANTHCVMYFANARLQSLLEFVREFINNGNSIVFDSDCLADVDAQQ